MARLCFDKERGWLPGSELPINAATVECGPTRSTPPSVSLPSITSLDKLAFFLLTNQVAVAGRRH